MTDRDHLMSLRADVGTLMTALAMLLLDMSAVRGMYGGSNEIREQSERMAHRAEQILKEIE